MRDVVSSAVCARRIDNDGLGVRRRRPPKRQPCARSAQNRLGYRSSLWWFEVRNTLVINERRKRLTEARTLAFLQRLNRLSIGVEHYTDEQQILALARRHVLSVYDAAYLELAQRMHVSLATLDHRLAAAARAEGVPLIEAPP